MHIKSAKIKECPYCGSRKITTGIQAGYAAVSTGRFFGSSSPLVHDICTQCGAVLLTRVDRLDVFQAKYEKQKMKED